MKATPPTIRTRQRYIVFQVYGEEKFKKDEVVHAITRTGTKFLGDLGYSKAKSWLIDFDSGSQKGILRIVNTEKDNIKATLVLIKELGEKRARINVLGVSGTIKRAKEKWW